MRSFHKVLLGALARHVAGSAFLAKVFSFNACLLTIRCTCRPAYLTRRLQPQASRQILGACELKRLGDTGGLRAMPPKIRELIAQLERAGFEDRGGKGSHRNYVHPKLSKPITISGKLGDDAKQYQIKAVRNALVELEK